MLWKVNVVDKILIKKLLDLQWTWEVLFKWELLKEAIKKQELFDVPIITCHYKRSDSLITMKTMGDYFHFRNFNFKHKVREAPSGPVFSTGIPRWLGNLSTHKNNLMWLTFSCLLFWFGLVVTISLLLLFIPRRTITDCCHR